MGGCRGSARHLWPAVERAAFWARNARPFRRKPDATAFDQSSRYSVLRGTTVLRMWIAFTFSLLFTLTVGYAAAKNRTARAFILPAPMSCSQYRCLAFFRPRWRDSWRFFLA